MLLPPEAVEQSTKLSLIQLESLRLEIQCFSLITGEVPYPELSGNANARLQKP